jgi:predicted ATPase/transcriptional regulator with XRE-family HTH domain
MSIISVESFHTFGDMLKYLRRRARITQRELSIAVNYSEAQISRLERNLRPPDLAALTALFIPALFIEDEPELVSRLMELAAHARSEERLYKDVVTITQTTQEKIVEDVRIVDENVNNNLPLQLTSFVGREHEIAEIKNLLDTNPDTTRLITLTGSGGCGKTRLALETASQLVKSYSDGIWLIELASASNPSHVHYKFISSLGLPEPSEETPTRALTKFLRTKHLLLIVDNCEHVRQKTAMLLKEILLTCPYVQILATSREILHIPGEVRFNIPSLTISNDVNSESVKLFVERARSTLPIFELTEDNASSVIQICRRLEGIPLAIELAAAQVAVLTVHQIASMLDSSFQLLAGGSSILERHRTMETTISWSYDLLSKTERALLRRLSVFSGGWTLEAAESVASDQTLIPVEGVLELLSQLVNKSLVIVKLDSRSEARYYMLQTVLEFAREKLLSRRELENLRERHFNYFCSMALQREQELLNDRCTIDWAETEINNLRAVLSWVLTAENGNSPSSEHTGKAMELMSHIHILWLARGYFSEGKGWLAKLLAVHTAETLFRARALVLASVFAANDGDHKHQFALMQQSLALSKKLKDRKHIAWSICWMGLAERDQHNYDEAIQYLTEGLEILEELKENIWISYVTYFLAESHMLKGNLETAKSFWKQGIHFCRKEDFSWQIGWGKEGLGTAERLEGNYKQAKRHYLASLDIRRTFNDMMGISSLFNNLALLAADQNRYKMAVKLWSAAEKLHLRLKQWVTTLDKDPSPISTARFKLGEDVFNSSWAEGQVMKLQEVIEYALNGTEEIR